MMDPKTIHPADQLVMVMDRVYRYGLTTTSGGNISVRDEAGDIWITPSGVDKGTIAPEVPVLILSGQGVVVTGSSPL
jgi:L-fuculose-phosphate aldolase